jgi:bifunctional ADP-heptose synthase (sugar kinase/adenylyltransferase)
LRRWRWPWPRRPPAEAAALANEAAGIVVGKFGAATVTPELRLRFGDLTTGHGSGQITVSASTRKKLKIRPVAPANPCFSAGSAAAP